MPRIAITLAISITVAACIPPGTLPGSVEVGKSRFDGRQYVRVAPGWVASLNGKNLDAVFGGPFKVGAMVHTELGTVLVVRVDDTTRITGVEVRVDEVIHELDKYGSTKIETSFDDPYDIKNSEGAFTIDIALLERMTSGAGNVWVRVTTGDGYLEGDFGKTCSSRWPDRACIAVRKMLAEAKRLELGGKRT